MINFKFADSLDADLARNIASRRDLFRTCALKLGALASGPIMLATVVQQAFGQGLPQQVVDILNYALTLEYLESEFYRTALLHSDLIPQDVAVVFQTISAHETAHVATLTGALGAAAVAKPNFDFTAGGKYEDIFRNFKTFIAVSQTLEDTGVAAFAGQLPMLTGKAELLTTALRIHSVEARHAAQVRRLRGEKPWRSAFDRPLSKGQVLAIAKPFFAS